MPSRTRRAGRALLVLGLIAATPWGWRGDGTGVFADAGGMAEGDPPPTAWRQPLARKGHGSPVVAGGRVCFTEEPTTLRCLDATTGASGWSATHDVVDAVPPSEAATIRARIAAAETAEAELDTVRAEYGLLRRRMRADPEGTAAAMDALTERLGALQQTVDAAKDYRAVGLEPTIGWASPTPVTDGEHVWAFFGNGVVACHTLDGTRVWQRWLGPLKVELRGYRGQSTASPRLAGDVLVVGHNTLHGLDAATGETRWEAGPYRDFGTPAVADVDGLAVVLTPDGRAVRARDGAELAKGLGDLWYAGPVVHGDVAYWIGTTPAEGNQSTWPTRAIAVRLARRGDDLVTTPLWDEPLPVRRRFYAQPVWWRDHLVTGTVDGDLVLLDPATGTAVTTTKAVHPTPVQLWVSPMVADGHLWLLWESGILDRHDDLDLVADGTRTIPQGRATPAWLPDGVIHRGQSTLVRYRP